MLIFHKGYALLFPFQDNRLNFFTVSYALDGTLQRWGHLRFQDLLLCPFHKNSWMLSENSIRFAQKYEKIECDLTMEHILDMAKMYGNQRFMSIFLNYSNIDEPHRMMLHTIPILIEDITLENKVRLNANHFHSHNFDRYVMEMESI